MPSENRSETITVTENSVVGTRNDSKNLLGKEEIAQNETKQMQSEERKSKSQNSKKDSAVKIDVVLTKKPQESIEPQVDFPML